MSINNSIIDRAYLEKPEGKIDILDLYDNGAMADNFENDGIYSRYYPPVDSAGRYTVECQVWDDGSAFVNDGFIGGSNIVVNDPGILCTVLLYKSDVQVSSFTIEM